MALRVKARLSHGAVIPTASMADIAFLLIIFFMVTMSFEKDKTQVVLPKTELRFEVPKNAAIISVTNVGQIRVSTGEEMSTLVGDQDVVTFAANVVSTFPGREFILKADNGVPYKTVDKVIDSLKQAKVETIYLLSQQKTVEGTGGGS